MPYATPTHLRSTATGADTTVTSCGDEVVALSQAMAETHLLTHADQAQRAARAEPDQLVRQIENFGYGFEELGEAVDEGLETLDELITLLTGHDVLIIHIG